MTGLGRANWEMLLSCDDPDGARRIAPYLTAPIALGPCPIGALLGRGVVAAGPTPVRAADDAAAGARGAGAAAAIGATLSAGRS
jgi:hypothetical protein